MQVVIIGAGFGGLAAAWELVRRGIKVTVLEQDDEVGGLAGSFRVGNTQLEKFYHHWFTSDVHIMRLINALGLQDKVVVRATRTGMYYAHNFFRLSSPLDLLRFKPLPLIDRLRLGLLVPRMQLVRDWHKLEQLTAAEWIRKTSGERVYEVVWQPLLRGKFGSAADKIAAVWLWNKLKLRGGSRSKDGREQLAYLQGGFAMLATKLAAAIQAKGGIIKTRTAARGIATKNGQLQAVLTDDGNVDATHVIATPCFADYR